MIFDADGFHNSDFSEFFGESEGDCKLQNNKSYKNKTNTYDKKNTILSEGRPAKQIGVVLDGSAQIQRVDYYGNRSILII